MSADIVQRMVRKYGLDLTGLTVFTEAATGPYAWTAPLAAWAGAQVLATGPRGETQDAADSMGVFVANLDTEPGCPWDADIITNTGHVRPINSALVARMEPTCVVPLMWETWEHRPAEVDLNALKARGIVCMGTDEDAIGFGRWLRLMARKLASDRQSRGVTVYGTSWVREFTDGAHGYCRAAGYRGQAPLALLSEHRCSAPLFGSDGTYDVERIRGCDVVHVCGNVGDWGAVKAVARSTWPEDPAPFGRMSVTPAILGAEPVLDLYAAGLSVGACLARARLAGKSPRDAALHALRHSPAQDFEGVHSWTA